MSVVRIPTPALSAGSVKTKYAMSLPKMGSVVPNGDCFRKRRTVSQVPVAAEPTISAKRPAAGHVRTRRNRLTSSDGC
jgi:hypothetical protein